MDLTVTVDAGGGPAAATLAVPDPPGPPRPARPMVVGLNVAPEAYGEWFPKLPTPAFSRVFSPPGSGLPDPRGTKIAKLPAGTIPHASHKDAVAMKTVDAYWSAWPAGRKLWWTYRHEAEPDVDNAAYLRYWTELRRLRDGHPRAADITLVNIHTLYASRWKATVDWRAWMLPDVADVEGWDCYPPTNFKTYEPPESMLGLPIQAAAEFGTRWSLPELGTTRRAFDSTGQARADWFTLALRLADAAGCEAVGLWCSKETVDGKLLDFRPTDPVTFTAWRVAMATYNSAAAANILVA